MSNRGWRRFIAGLTQSGRNAPAIIRLKSLALEQGRAETFGGAGAQSIKGAHGTWLLIGLCSLLICVSKWMLLYWYSSKCHDAGLKKIHRTEKTILSLNVKDIFVIIMIIIVVVVIEFTGYGGFAVVNTTVVVVKIYIPDLFKIEFYSNPVLNLFIFWMIMIIKTGLISIIWGTRKSV